MEALLAICTFGKDFDIGPVEVTSAANIDDSTIEVLENKDKAQHGKKKGRLKVISLQKTKWNTKYAEILDSYFPNNEHEPINLTRL